jgi:pantothenate kinase-related protein Tda10
MENNVEGWMLGYSIVIFSVLAMVVNASRDENFEGDMFSFNVLLNDGSWEALVQMLEYE